MFCTAARAACWSAEPFQIERLEVDVSRLAACERCNQLARDCRERQTEMLVAEGVEQIRGSPAAAQRWQIIGQGGARTEPFAVRFAQGQAELCGMASEARPLAWIGGRLCARELDEAGSAQPGAERRDDHRAFFEHDGRQASGPRSVSRLNVIAALGNDRNSIAERF